MVLPHCGHFSSSGTSCCFWAPPSCLVVLHSGYPEHARNCPNRPFLSTIGRPQFSQYSVSSCSETPPVSDAGSSRVLVHSGYPVHAMNFPCRPHLITIGLPHFSQTRSVATSIRLMSVMCSAAWS